MDPLSLLAVKNLLILRLGSNFLQKPFRVNAAAFSQRGDTGLLRFRPRNDHLETCWALADHFESQVLVLAFWDVGLPLEQVARTVEWGVQTYPAVKRVILCAETWSKAVALRNLLDSDKTRPHASLSDPLTVRL